MDPVDGEVGVDLMSCSLVSKHRGWYTSFNIQQPQLSPQLQPLSAAQVHGPILNDGWWLSGVGK